MYKPRYTVTMALLVLATTCAFGADDAMPVDCDHCHVAAVPISGAAQLKACTRATEASEPGHTSAEAPDVFILDQLSEIYVPVVFPHKLHAVMTEMGKGCDICHHRSPEGRIPPCRECHGGPSNPINLRQPGLKGAYHRQCLSCHREWSHATACVVCHAKIDPNHVFVPPKDLTDIMGTLHPNVEVPDVKVYQVEDLEETPFVTFHHKDHVELFGLKCVDCHEKETCNRCHDVGTHEPHVRQDPHEDCSRCHQQKPTEADCMFCHKEEVVERFDHGRRSGFVLRASHRSLACVRCHAEDSFAGLSKECLSCHEEPWPPEDFDHKRIGVIFAEDHEELDCEDCHAKGYSEALSCDGCHEDDRQTFPPPEEGKAKEGGENEAAKDAKSEA